MNPQPKPTKRPRKPPKRIRVRRPAGTVRREAKAAGYVDPDTKEAVARFYNGMCGYCGVKVGEHWDHMKPLSKGGEDRIENLVLCCARCNFAKGQRTWTPLRRHPYMEQEG